ncbi:MAG: hypothetical protein CMQ41_16290 [Gammaproteobacteria bacterium]|nr:hypothetical protein [Gammaproteobacteria bacterium]
MENDSISIYSIKNFIYINNTMRWHLKLLCFFISLSFMVLRFASATPLHVEESSVSLGEQFTLTSKGAYRLKAGTVGISRPAYSAGPIAVSNDDRVLFIAGHAQHFGLGSYLLSDEPGFGDINTLPIAENLSPFVKINPQNKFPGSVNRITGIETLDEHLLVMTDEYYDANTDNNNFLVLLNNNTNLEQAKQVGFFSISAKSHAAGWMSEVPAPLSKELDALYIAGSASNIPINARHSIGPTLFTWFPYFLENVKPKGVTLVMEPLIDYSLDNPLHPNLNNKNGKNDLWTELSYAAFGFISPDQSKYIVIGHSGGHDSGVGYKITQKNGHQCGGYCAIDDKDYYNYFWIYSVSDIKKSFAGAIEPHEVKPIEYGRLPLLNHRHLIKGADFNHRTNHLYLSIDNLDTTQSEYESQPLIWVFELTSN